MKKKHYVILLTILILVAAVVVVGLQVRNSMLEKEKADAIILKANGREIIVSVASLSQEEFSGETVNGKGEHFTHSYRGIALKSLLEKNKISLEGITSVTAYAVDQFSAVYAGDEVREGQRVYLAVQMDGVTIEGIEKGKPGVQVIVFGDPNSKRLVRNLQTLEVQ